ncbi:hypothetical protein HZ994_18160 [Akkermansiaceae bacterium]|nr:hypothetical protein HZ994_18160 [Akkermansiaceae bacterium]
MLRSQRRFPNRKWFLIPLAGFALVLALASCSEPTPKPPPIPVTDTKPVGDGLKIIGFSLLGGAVVSVLGKMIR